jgi:flagellar hook-associated protein 1 FlgK
MTTSLLSVLSLARDGVLASAGALDVTSQNIAGASTPGFVRRMPNVAARPTGGVELAAPTRSFDKFAWDQVVGQEALLSAARVRQGVLAEVESLVAPETGTLADKASALVAAFRDLSLQPADLGVRSVVLARADELASAFSETASALVSLRNEQLAQARAVVSEVNDRLDRLARVDAQLAETLARGGSVADLLDTRDQLVRDVAQRIGGRAVQDADGKLTVFGAGGVLYEGGRPTTIGVAVDPSGNLAFSATRAGAATDVTAYVVSGTLGGVREARDVDLSSVAAALDGFAYDVANAMNALHTSGVGLDGVGGRPLFVPPTGVSGAAYAMAIDPSVAGAPRRVAAADVSSDLPSGNAVALQLANASETALAGGGTMSERFASIAGRIGVARNAADGDVSLRESTVATASALRESASGVSTDEEMIRMQQFQRSFEAATRVLRVVDELFDSLMKSI